MQIGGGIVVLLIVAIIATLLALVTIDQQRIDSLRRALATQIEPRLGDLAIPAPLAAMQIAEAQLGLVNAWVTGRSSCAASDIADALASTSRAVAEALSQR